MIQIRYALGIDIGGTNVKLGIVRQDGEVIASSRFPSETMDDSTQVFVSHLEASVSIMARAVRMLMLLMNMYALMTLSTAQKYLHYSCWNGVVVT